jgi:hypothetical protein
VITRRSAAATIWVLLRLLLLERQHLLIGHLALKLPTAGAAARRGCCC